VGGNVSRVEPYAAVILAGGAARRLGGVDKPMLAVGGRPMLDRVLDAVPDAVYRIVVGPPSLRLPPGVRRVQEQPRGGGPVAAAAAGLAVVDAPVVALLAADLPFLDRAAILALRTRLAASTASATSPADAALPLDRAQPGDGVLPADRSLAAGGAPSSDGALPPDRAVPADGAVPLDGAVFLDGDGRRQTLCGVWRTDALRAALARLGPPAGVPLRALLAGVRVAEVPGITDGPPPWYDCDDLDDLHRAEEWI
jgi:molybdopterin-guanine dinucleotide biosynthesis protein A